jgi:hypothetical protein
VNPNLDNEPFNPMALVALIFAIGIIYTLIEGIL